MFSSKEDDSSSDDHRLEVEVIHDNAGWVKKWRLSCRLSTKQIGHMSFSRSTGKCMPKLSMVQVNSGAQHFALLPLVAEAHQYACLGTSRVRNLFFLVRFTPPHTHYFDVIVQRAQ